MLKIEYVTDPIIELIESMGDDMSIVRAARVSYAGESKGGVADKKLIRYLLTNGHTSPFEHVVFTFRVEAPLFVARQWMRHRTWSFNEVSYRYTQAPPKFWIPKNWRTQGTDNKQMSGGMVAEAQNKTLLDLYKNSIWIAVNAYETLLNAGVSREMARSILPTSLFTSFYATVDLHNLLHFLKLRLHPHAQPEIAQYAESIRGLIWPIVPWTMQIWEESWQQ